MSQIIDLCSAAGSGNVGQMKCDPKRGNFKAFIICGAAFTPSQYSTSIAFEAALLAAMQKGSGDSGKAYPFPEVTTVTENTSANKVATLGNGTQIPLSEGRPSYDLGQYIGINQEKAMRKFNNQIVPVFIFDSNGGVYGRLDAQNNFVGVNASIFTKGAGFGDYNNAKETVTSLAFQSASDFYDYAAFVPTNFSVADLQGLLDVTFKKFATSGSNVHHIQAFVQNAQITAPQNIYSIYKTPLNSTTMWVGYSSTGVAVTPSAVAFNDTNSGWDITFPSAVVSVNLVNPTVLAAANIVGIEGVLFSVV